GLGHRNVPPDPPMAQLRARELPPRHEREVLLLLPGLEEHRGAGRHLGQRHRFAVGRVLPVGGRVQADVRERARPGESHGLGRHGEARETDAHLERYLRVVGEPRSLRWGGAGVLLRKRSGERASGCTGAQPEEASASRASRTRIAWCTRAATVGISLCISSNSGANITIARRGVVATTVAVRRSRSTMAISPKKSPGPRFATCLPAFVTSTVPSRIAKNS